IFIQPPSSTDHESGAIHAKNASLSCFVRSSSILFSAAISFLAVGFCANASVALSTIPAASTPALSLIAPSRFTFTDLKCRRILTGSHGRISPENQGVGAMKTTRIVLVLLLSAMGIGALQTGGDAVRIDPDDIGGVVASAKGPEAGVWVIAETADLSTKFVKIVVTDDRGRYVIPDLPKANYSVWVRGYGL